MSEEYPNCMICGKQEFYTKMIDIRKKTICYNCFYNLNNKNISERVLCFLMRIGREQ